MTMKKSLSYIYVVKCHKVMGIECHYQ